MKTLATAAAMLLVALAIPCMTSCGNGDKDADKSDSSKNVAGQKQGEAFASSINIRYVDMDTLLAHYDLAIELNAQAQQINAELQQYQTQLARQLQSKQAAIQQKVQNNGYLSEASYNADMAELQKLDQTLGAQNARRQEIDGQRILDLNKQINDAIDAYVVEYNKKYHYDAIVHKQAALYFNPALDVTAELLEGLNALYKEQKKAAPAAKTDAK